MGVPTINTSTWFGSGTASTAVLTPAQVALVAPLVRVTAAYIFMYYAFCFFQSWSKLYLCASRRPKPTYTPSTRDAIAAIHVRHRTGGGQRPRTPTARGRRSCS